LHPHLCAAAAAAKQTYTCRTEHSQTATGA
jgi:hypothetical protein